MIVWKLTEQQADQVMNALAHRPYLEVNGLIGELLKQAQNPQLQQAREFALQPREVQQAMDASVPAPEQRVNGAAAP